MLSSTSSVAFMALSLGSLLTSSVQAGDCVRRNKLAVRDETRAGLEKRVTTPTNLSPGSWTADAGCARYRTAVSGDTCVDILAANSDLGTSLSLFYTINPAVNNQCTNLVVGQAYCLGLATPATVPAGTLTVQNGCIKYYTVKSGDYCDAIVAANANVHLTLSQFYAANPVVNSQCSNLWVGSSYCVGVRAVASASATSKAAAKPTATVTASSLGKATTASAKVATSTKAA